MAKGPKVSSAQYTKNCVHSGRSLCTRQMRLKVWSMVRISSSEVTTSITMPIAVRLLALPLN